MGYSGHRGIIEKRHTCNRCGCVFAYGIDPHDWKTPWMSQNMKPEGSVRCYPCPDCGMYQPEMVMWLKVAIPLSLMAAFLALLIVGAVGFASSGANAVLAAQIGVGVFAVYALFQVGTVFHNPNADLAENRAVARQMIKDRRLEVVSPGDPESAPRPPRNFGLGYVPGLLLVLAGPAGFVLAILQLSSGKEPPAANDHCSPAVVLPGEKVRYTCHTCTAEGVSGDIWRGAPTVRVHNAKALGLPETLPATGSDRQWGEKFSVSKKAGNQTIKPVITFTLPNDARLANQTVRLSVSMTITYPKMVQGGLIPDFLSSTKYFADTNHTISEQVALKVADQAAVAEARNAFLLGLAGAGVALLGGVWLTGAAWCLVRKASRSEVVRDSDPEPCAPEPEPEAKPARLKNGYELLGIDNPCPPVVSDFDRSKWGDRRLR
jgi:hypothetical protein